MCGHCFPWRRRAADPPVGDARLEVDSGFYGFETPHKFGALAPERAPQRIRMIGGRHPATGRYATMRRWRAGSHSKRRATPASASAAGPK